MREFKIESLVFTSLVDCLWVVGIRLLDFVSCMEQKVHLAVVLENAFLVICGIVVLVANFSRRSLRIIFHYPLF